MSRLWERRRLAGETQHAGRDAGAPRFMESPLFLLNLST